MTDKFSYDADSNTFVAERELPNDKVHRVVTTWNKGTTPDMPFSELVEKNKEVLDNADKAGASSTNTVAKKGSLFGFNLYFGRTTNANFDEGSVAVGRYQYKWPVGGFLKGKFIKKAEKQRFMAGLGGARNAVYVAVSRKGK